MVTSNQEVAVTKPGPDFNLHAAPSEQAEGGVGAGSERGAGPIQP